MTILFETERLIARAPNQSDFDNLYSLQSDPKVMEFIGKGTPRTKVEVQESLNEIILYYQKHGFGFFSIFEKETGEFVGQGGIFHLNFQDTQKEFEVGYRLHVKFWGKGIATELTKALIEWGFENLTINKIFGIIKPENSRSRNVLLKAGMRYLHRTDYSGFVVDKFVITKK